MNATAGERIVQRRDGRADRDAQEYLTFRRSREFRGGSLTDGIEGQWRDDANG